MIWKIFFLFCYLSASSLMLNASKGIPLRAIVTPGAKCRVALSSATSIRLEDLKSEAYFTLILPRDFLLMPDIEKILRNNPDIPKQFNSSESISVLVKQTTQPGSKESEWSSELVSKKGPLFEEVMSRVDVALDDMQREGTLTPDEVIKEKEFERNIDINRVTYFAFWDPQNIERPTMVMSLFDGSQIASADQSFESILDPSNRLLPEESKYGVRFPERSTLGVERIFSLRRLGVERGIVDGVYPLLDRVANHLIFRHGYNPRTSNAWLGGAIYLTAGRAGRTNYASRYKFETRYGPSDLQLEKDSTPLWIQRMDANDFLQRYLVPQDTEANEPN